MKGDKVTCRKKSEQIAPSDLRQQAEELIRAGMMPSLEEVLKAVAEVREKYVPQINASRRQSKRKSEKS
jgi:hypothetical protein